LSASVFNELYAKDTEEEMPNLPIISNICLCSHPRLLQTSGACSHFLFFNDEHHAKVLFMPKHVNLMPK
jgi:hypothetical protein